MTNEIEEWLEWLESEFKERTEKYCDAHLFGGAMGAIDLLLAENKALLLTLDKARESLAECDEAMGYMSEYDIPLCMPDRVKDALSAIAPYAEAIKKARD